MNNEHAADALKQHEEMAARRARNAKRYPPMAPGPMGGVWRYVMTPQQEAEREQRIKQHGLPF